MLFRSWKRTGANPGSFRWRRGWGSNGEGGARSATEADAPVTRQRRGWRLLRPRSSLGRRAERVGFERRGGAEITISYRGSRFFINTRYVTASQQPFPERRISRMAHFSKYAIKDQGKMSRNSETHIADMPFFRIRDRYGVIQDPCRKKGFMRVPQLLFATI